MSCSVIVSVRGLTIDVLVYLSPPPLFLSLVQRSPLHSKASIAIKLPHGLCATSDMFILLTAEDIFVVVCCDCCGHC